MKKQSGFTLIELMVVLAIIALLAVAGLAAYVGYVKKARDTARISDISTINKALLTMLTENGKSPGSIADVITIVEAVNSGVLVKDPTQEQTVCLDETGASGATCGYYYIQCDNGGGFAVSTRFESSTNTKRYATDGIDVVTGLSGTVDSDDDDYWSLGSCTAKCANATECGTPSIVTHTIIKA